MRLAGEQAEVEKGAGRGQILGGSQHFPAEERRLSLQGNPVRQPEGREVFWQAVRKRKSSQFIPPGTKTRA